jgi:hypothetical protein
MIDTSSFPLGHCELILRYSPECVEEKLPEAQFPRVRFSETQLPLLRAFTELPRRRQAVCYTLRG